MKSFFIFILFILLYGCKSKIENRIIRKLELECSGGANCVIDLRTLTTFEWEKMYIFPSWFTSDSIQNTIGIKYMRDDVQDSYSRMLFVDKNKVVYEEDFISLDYNNSTIAFQENNSAFYTGKNYIPSSEAYFKVVRGKIEGSCKKCYFYSLGLAENNSNLIK